MARGLPRKIAKRNELHSRRSQEFYNSGGSGSNSLSSSNANSADNLNTAADASVAVGQDQQQSLQPQGAADGASQSTTPVPSRKKGKKKARGNRSQESLNGANGAGQGGGDETNATGGSEDANANEGEGAHVDTMQILSSIDGIIGSSGSSSTATNSKAPIPSPRTRLPPLKQDRTDQFSASASTPSSVKLRKSTSSRSPSPDSRASERDAGVCHLDMNANDPLFFSAPNPRISPRSAHKAWVQIAPNASTSPSTGDLDKSLPGTWVSSTEGLNSNSYTSKPKTIPASMVDIQIIPVSDIFPDDSTATSNDDISSMVNEPPHSPQSMLSSRATSPAISTTEVHSTVAEAATSPKLTAASVTSSSSVSPTTEFNEGPLSPPPTPAVLQDMFKGRPAKAADESGQASSPVNGPGTPPPTPLTTVSPGRVASPKVESVNETAAASSPVNQGPGTPPSTPFTVAPPVATAAAKPSSATTRFIASPILQPAPNSLQTHHLPSGSLGLATTPESMEQLGVTFAQTPQAHVPTPLHSHDFAFKPVLPSSPPTANSHATTATTAQRATSRSPSPSSTALILHPGNSPKARPLSPSPSPPPAPRSRQTSVTLGLSGTMLRHTLLLPTSSTSPCASPVLKVRSGPSM